MNTTLNHKTWKTVAGIATFIALSSLTAAAAGPKRQAKSSSPRPQRSQAQISSAPKQAPLTSQIPFAPTVTTYSNPTPIAILDNAIASPYPSNIIVAGECGTVTKVTVKLNDLSHSFPDDIDVLLVGPQGQTAVIMSDTGANRAVTGIFLTLDDDAVRHLPEPLDTGTFQPTNNGSSNDPFPGAAPPHTNAADLTAFNGTNPNGTWSLYVVDDRTNDTGSFAGGWELNITTTCTASPTPTPSPTPTATATATATAT